MDKEGNEFEQFYNNNLLKRLLPTGGLAIWWGDEYILNFFVRYSASVPTDE
jgi:hypothetical protein